jgi:hypothetical protein
MSNSDRTLEILFRVLRGEEISVKKIADEHGISTKSVSRDIGRIKDFLAEYRDLTGNAELEYCYVVSDANLCFTANCIESVLSIPDRRFKRYWTGFQLQK